MPAGPRTCLVLAMLLAASGCGAALGDSIGGPGTPAPPSAAPGTIARHNPVRIFMHVKDIERATWTDADYRTAARRYDMIVLRVPDQKKVSMLKAENASLKVLLYYQSTFSGTRSEVWKDLDPHEDWFVHDTSGQRIRHAAQGWYLLNVGNAGYRQYVADRLTRKAAEFGFDGAYLDRADFDAQLTSDAAWTGPLPDGVRQNWFDWVTGFLRYLRDNTGGLYVIYNTLEWNPGGYAKSNDSPHLDLVTQGNMEGFAHADWQSGTAFSPRQAWEYQMGRVAEAAGKGKAFSAQSGVDATRTTPEQLARIQDYALATYLLAADGRLVYMTFVSEQDSGTDATLYLPGYDAPIGAPAGAAVKVGAAYVREFASGKVVVNPDDKLTVTIDLGGAFRRLDGTTLTAVTLAPKTGIILLK